MSNKPLDKLHTEFGFTTPIPDEIIKAAPRIKATGYLVWSYLMFRIYNAKRAAGDFECFPGIALISKETGLGKNAVVRAIKRLESEGFLTKKRRFGNSTIYTLTGTEVQNPQNEQTEAVDLIFNSPVSPKRVHQFPQNGDIVSPKRVTNQEEVNQDKVNKEEDINTLLSKIGIKNAAIKTLIKEKPIERLQHGIDVYQQGISRKEPLKPGWYMQFINEDWADPSWYVLDSDSDESRQR